MWISIINLNLADCILLIEGKINEKTGGKAKLVVLDASMLVLETYLRWKDKALSHFKLASAVTSLFFAFISIMVDNWIVKLVLSLLSFVTWGYTLLIQIKVIKDNFSYIGYFCGTFMNILDKVITWSCLIGVPSIYITYFMSIIGSPPYSIPIIDFFWNVIKYII